MRGSWDPADIGRIAGATGIGNGWRRLVTRTKVLHLDSRQ